MPSIGQTGIVYTDLGGGMVNITFPDGHGFTTLGDAPPSDWPSHDDDILMLRLAVGALPRPAQNLLSLFDPRHHAAVVARLTQAQAIRPEHAQVPRPEPLPLPGGPA